MRCFNSDSIKTWIRVDPVQPNLLKKRIGLNRLNLNQKLGGSKLSDFAWDVSDVRFLKIGLLETCDLKLSGKMGEKEWENGGTTFAKALAQPDLVEKSWLIRLNSKNV